MTYGYRTDRRDTHPAFAAFFCDLIEAERIADHEEFILQPDRLNCGTTGAIRRGATVAHTLADSQQALRKGGSEKLLQHYLLLALVAMACSMRSSSPREK